MAQIGASFVNEDEIKCKILGYLDDIKIFSKEEHFPERCYNAVQRKIAPLLNQLERENDPGFGMGDTSFFKGNTMTYYGRWTYKYEEAARQGATGILVSRDL